MDNTIVLLHGMGTSSSSWNPVASSLAASGAKVFAPDLLGYGRSPAPTGSYGIDEEVAHLVSLLATQNIDALHLVAHSYGCLIGLYLRRALDGRVKRLTLIEPILVSVLHECGEDKAAAEMEEQYQCFRYLSEDHDAAAQFFVDHWAGAGAWDSMGKRMRTMLASCVPKMRLEMTATRSDTAKLAWLADAPPPTTIVVGEKTLLPPRVVASRLAPAFAAATVAVPGAAHMIPMTHPGAVIEAVRDAACGGRGEERSHA
jgi:pimeloyl-ACP methyl ester carboxylesterase